MSLRQMGNLYSELDDGTGCCKYFNKSTRLCSIYDNRPLKCKIKEGYKAYFSDISYQEYIKITKEGCKILKENKNNTKKLS